MPPTELHALNNSLILEWICRWADEDWEACVCTAQMKEQRLRMQIKAPWNPDKSEDSTFDVTQAVVQANLWPGGLVAKSYVMQPRKCPQRVHVSGSPPMFPTSLVCLRKNSIYWLQQLVTKSRCGACFTSWPAHLQSHRLKEKVHHLRKFAYVLVSACGLCSVQISH